MKAVRGFISILALVLVFAGNAFALPFRVVGYFESGHGGEENVQYDYLTHVNYAFLVPSKDGGLGTNDIARIRNLVRLAHAKNVKVCISVGGWNDGDDGSLRAIASNAATRTVFINNLVAFVVANGLDGVDMDWEFPVGASGDYAALMSELSARLHAQGKLLTAAVWGWNSYGFPTSVFPHVDFLNLMAYDRGDPHSSYVDAADAIGYWKNLGLPRGKMVLGVPFFGREPYQSYESLVASDALVPYRDENGYENVNGCYYNSIPTIRKKTVLAADQTSGIMIWALNQDTKGSTSLLLAIHDAAKPYQDAPSGAKYAGVRSSGYGIDPFPTATGWGNALSTMASTFPGSQPTAIWIVGTVDSSIDGTNLEFPSDGQSHERISFSSTDRHEAYLDYFDQNGMKVFLQVEPGFADVNALIDLVLARYKHHSSVIGFGVDVEWYQNATDGQPGVRVTDAIAMGWESKVKSHDNSYRLFIKHFDKTYLSPTFRGDIVFVDDTQQFSDIGGLVGDMVDFADYFYPNTVMYQIGYPDDRPWWSKYANPPKSLGDELVAATRQECGIIWVDFTLREVLPTDPDGPDLIPPSVIAKNPPDGATGIPIGTSITVTFSEAMDASSIVPTAFILASAGGNVSVTASHSGSQTTFIPASTLAYDSTYTATVTTAVKDVAGNHMTSDRTWTFTTQQASTGGGGSGSGGGGCTVSPVGSSDDSSAAGRVLALFSPLIALAVRRTKRRMQKRSSCRCGAPRSTPFGVLGPPR